MNKMNRIAIRATLLLVLFLFGWTPFSQAEQTKPAKEITGLLEMLKPLVGEEIKAKKMASARVGKLPKDVTEGKPLPENATVLAYEENEYFISVLAQLPGKDKVNRRIIFIRPSTWLIEDTLGDASLTRVLSEGNVSKQTMQRNTKTLTATFGIGEKEYVLELPSVCTGAGWITITGAEGKELIARRPLASGILPHGPEGVKLMARWDKFYHKGKTPPWNQKQASGDLQKAVENGDLKPGRIVVLGCGSGMNAIYLAKKGFDVTAIDVAPTALGIAERDAQKAGVKVKWVLADVLNLPEFKPFESIFDRGCYHNVRYVDAKGFVEATKDISRPGTKFLNLSCNRERAPGVTEETFRGDFADSYEFEWFKPSQIVVGTKKEREIKSWCVMLVRKKEK